MHAEGVAHLEGSADTRRNAGGGTEPAGRQKPPPLVGVVWTLLVVNTLGSSSGETIVPIPGTVAQLITMSALCVAFVLALLLNPRLRVRPSGFLLVLSLLLVVSVVSSAFLESGLGALARCARLALFLATLWLITRWWDGALTFVRHHIRALGAVLLSVAAGLVLAPGLAMPETYDGRLVGALWYLPAPQVAQHAAVVAGLILVLWLARCLGGWTVIGIAGPAVILLLLTHTRTATVALLAALVAASLSLVLSNARARQALVGVALGSGLAAVASGPVLLRWFRRGQGEDALESLTGRQKLWDALLAEPRTLAEQLFGVGLTDKSFNGLPIDNGWLAIYHEQGLLGLTIVSAFLVALIIGAATRPSSPARACAIFLIVYCLVASYTEVGLGGASLYLLHLAVAASLLARGSHAFRTEVREVVNP